MKFAAACTCVALLGLLGLGTACSEPGRPSVGPPPADAPDVPDFALLDHHGNSHQLSEYAGRAAVVLFVQGNGCPIVRQSLAALDAVRRRFDPDDVAFLMLNANLQDDRQSVAAEARDYGLGMPVLLDPAQIVATSLDIDRTAEALIIDPSTLKLLWRGAIDDRLRYETQVEKPSRDQLAEALEAWLAGEPIPAADAPLRGCAIAFPRRSLATPSYANEVVPLLRNSCGACHAPDGIGPWAMQDHRTLLGWSAMIREVLLTRRMPPFAPDDEHLAFAHDISLSPDDTAMLVAWIDAGCPPGDEPDPLVSDPVRSPPHWELGQPDVVIDLPTHDVAATGVLPYINVEIEAPLERDLWIRAVQLRPGNAKVLHHALVFVNPPGIASDQHGIGERWKVGVFGMYAPGTGAYVFPPDAGIFLEKGSTIALQFHYTPTGRPEQDRSQLGLYASHEQPSQVYKMQGLINLKFVIPPGVSEHVVIGSHHFARDTWLHSFFPHMHFRGYSLKYEAHYPDGSVETLLSVPRYRFNWQFLYPLAEPKWLPAGTSVVAKAIFNNSRWNADNPDPSKQLRFGRQSLDEMMLAYVMYTEAQAGDGPPPSDTH